MDPSKCAGCRAFKIKMSQQHLNHLELKIKRDSLKYVTTRRQRSQLQQQQEQQQQHSPTDL